MIGYLFMQRRAFLALAVLLFLTAFPSVTAYGKKKGAVDAQKSATHPAQFFAKMPKDRKILHGLNRLTFGPRPQDVTTVKRIGLKKWIDRQLHPDSIPRNPVLEAKLEPLDSLQMSSAEMSVNYPAPDLVRQMVAGRIPFPADPEKRMMIQNLVRRYERKLKSTNGDDKPSIEKLGLSGEQVRIFKTGTAAQKLHLFQASSSETQDDLLEVMPYGARMQLFNVASPALRRKIEKANGPQQVVAQDLVDAKLYRAIYSNRQLQEVLTDFWYNHFNVFLDKGADRYMVTAYERDAIRPHVLGKFQDLLLATAKSPAMLFYLDNWQSAAPGAAPIGRGKQKKHSRGLNENYGRELLELHTLGVDGGYSQHDVTEVARCFTGWTIKDPQRGGAFEFDEKMHDKGEKTVLGVKIPAGGAMDDGLKVLDIVAHHPATARFISKKLAMRFVADNPPESLIGKMAKTFADTDGDVREVMQTMLKSPEFWSQGAYRAKIKSPLEMVASAVRALDANVDYAFGLAQQIAQLGQPLYRKPEPTGYSNAGQEWVNSAGLLARMNFALALAGNKIQGVKVDLARFGDTRFGGAKDAIHLATELLQTSLSREAHAAIEQGIATQKQGNGPGNGPQPTLVAGLTLGSPDFQRR